MRFQELKCYISGWRTTVNEHLCALELERLQHLDEEAASVDGAGMPGLCFDYFSAHDFSTHKSEAEVMYEQYLSEKVSIVVDLIYM